MRQMLIASRNPTKYALYRPIFQRYGFDVLTLEDVDSDGDSEQEVGSTAEENALAKARKYHSPQHPWVFANDAGLEIDALNGEPGLAARRWGGYFPDDVDDRTWLDYLLKRLDGVAPERRTAAFFSAYVLIAPDGSEHVRPIRYPFRIATHPIRPIFPGSPISAVRIGPEDAISSLSDDIFQHFERWGIMPGLLTQFPA